MTNKKKDSAASSAKQTTVKSRETGKVYRVVRYYRNSIMVAPIGRRGQIFTMPRWAFV